MGLDQVFDRLAKEWPVISGAPFSFAIAVVVVGGLIWLALNWQYGARLAHRDDEIAAYRRKLDGASPDEARDKIDALERRLQALEPRGLSPDQLAKMAAILARHPGTIDIAKDMGSPQASRLHSQLEKIFSQSGWEIRSPAMMGVSRPASGILLTTRTGDQTSEQAKCVIDAFSAAGLAFDRRREPTPPPGLIAPVFPELQILITDL